MSVSAADLVGAWELERFRITFADGREPVSPFGEEGRGLLVYTDAGRVSAILSRGDRPMLGVESLERAGVASEEARAAAFNSYLSYGGSFRVEGDEVVHRVELSLVPDTVGHEHRRRMRLEGDALTLSYDVVPRSGIVRSYCLRWKRLPARG